MHVYMQAEREGWIAMLHKATKLQQKTQHAAGPAQAAQPRAQERFGFFDLWRSA